MRTIYKYQLTVSEEQVISLPNGAEFLSAQIQRDVICLWVLIDPRAIGEQDWTFYIFGTGCFFNNDPDGMDYVSTLQSNNGNVYHLFVESKYEYIV